MTRSIRRFGFPLLFATALLLSGPALAEHHEQTEGAAVVIADEVNLTGRVISIDAATRTVVVEGELGRRVSIVAPEDAPNFDQIHVGDPVAATYVESIALAITPVAGAEPGASVVAAVSSAPPGATPSATMAAQIQLRAVVKAVDSKTRSVTLDVPSGGERTLKVQEGVDLEKVKAGDQVSLTLTRALAISIDKR
jgi:Cu/Ag efflux protein CusF